MSCKILGAFIAVAVVSMCVRVDAECIGTTSQWQQQHSDFVFDGTVIEVDRIADRESRATIEVYRVWKGKVQKNLTVYLMKIDWMVPSSKQGSDS